MWNSWFTLKRRNLLMSIPPSNSSKRHSDNLIIALQSKNILLLFIRSLDLALRLRISTMTCLRSSSQPYQPQSLMFHKRSQLCKRMVVHAWLRTAKMLCTVQRTPISRTRLPRLELPTSNCRPKKLLWRKKCITSNLPTTKTAHTRMAHQNGETPNRALGKFVPLILNSTFLSLEMRLSKQRLSTLGPLLKLPAWPLHMVTNTMVIIINTLWINLRSMISDPSHFYLFFSIWQS